MVPNATYTLDSGDKVRVIVFGQDNLSNVYSVDGSGAVALPLIGPVRARGLTTFELSNEIAGKLRRKYVKDPKVTVEVETYRPFFILGEVNKPGQYPFVNAMTVEAAVAIAEGTQNAPRSASSASPGDSAASCPPSWSPPTIPSSRAILFTSSNASSKAHRESPSRLPHSGSRELQFPNSPLFARARRRAVPPRARPRHRAGRAWRGGGNRLRFPHRRQRD